MLVCVVFLTLETLTTTIRPSLQLRLLCAAIFGLDAMVGQVLGRILPCLGAVVSWHQGNFSSASKYTDESKQAHV